MLLGTAIMIVEVVLPAIPERTSRAAHADESETADETQQLTSSPDPLALASTEQENASTAPKARRAARQIILIGTAPRAAFQSADHAQSGGYRSPGGETGDHRA